MIRSARLRRLATVAGAIGALVLAFASIRAASAWTAASAPLTVTPVSVSALESQLASEQDRSATLQEQLDALEAQSTDLASALEAARARIEADAGNARDLAEQLKTAKRRLAKLDATIKRGNAAAAAAASARGVQPAPASGLVARGGERDDHEGGGDD